MRLRRSPCLAFKELYRYSGVWGGCSLADSEKIKQVQSSAARIVTGLLELRSILTRPWIFGKK